MFKKIDKKLLEQVSSLDANKKVDCLVYANNYFYAKKYLTSCNLNIIEYPFIKAFGLKTDIKNLTKLAGLTQVKYISSVAKVFAQMDIAKKVHNIVDVQKKFTGKNVTVAVIDTGIAEHLDFCSFKNRIIAFKDFVGQKSYPYDDNGHGSFVCGVLGGNGFLSGKKYSGVAPNCNIVMCKALDSNGETGALTILKAMQWIYDNKNKYNIKVVCLSLGSQPLESGDPLMQGAEALWNEGIVVVCAAGNSGPENRTIKSPGTSGKIITVGAFNDGRNTGEVTEKNFEIAKFSSRGPAGRFYKPDCVATGVDINSVGIENFYTKMSGTSVSTPIVAGCVALLLEAMPRLSPIEVKSKIISCCQPFVFDRNSEGFGFVDASKLIKL